ncbi:MAG TPA: type II secretion system protein [Elusimicrobiota bacterium]|nr:type II secretion system protein [Elusimicrobiota bacterium]
MMSERRGSRGSTLIETLIAAALLGLVVASMLTLVAAVPRASAGLDRADRALQAAQGLQQALGSYVSADLTASTTAYAPGGAWKLAGDPCADAWTATCVHDAAAALPADLRAAGWRLTYTVSAAAPASGAQASMVQIQAVSP